MSLSLKAATQGEGTGRAGGVKRPHREMPSGYDVCIIDAKWRSKKNDHDGGPTWTQPTHLTTPQNPELVDQLHDPTLDAFVKIKGI